MNTRVVSAAAPRAGSGDPLTPADRRVSPRIVVAEHQSIIRMDLAEMLDTHGYQVIAQTGSFAETIPLTLFLQPDLLVLDRNLIPAVGDDPIDRIQRTQFPLAVLETYSTATGIAGGQRSGSRSYLPKPFTEDDLNRAVAQALTSPCPARDAAARAGSLGDSMPSKLLIERRMRVRARRRSATGRPAPRPKLPEDVPPTPERSSKMTLPEITRRYEQIQRSWPAARSPSELRDIIGELDGILEALEDTQTRMPTDYLWDRVNDLQGTLRLELAGPHSSRIATHTDDDHGRRTQREIPLHPSYLDASPYAR